MRFFKNHWFSLLIFGFMLCFLTVFVLILVSPRQDVKERGFIPCSKAMVTALTNCEHKILCSGIAVLDNNWCMLKVIGQGIKLWTHGEQPRPWSNYIFTPELPQSDYVDEEARKAYLTEYPDTLSEMQRLNLLRKDMENDEKNNLADEDIWNEE